MKRGGKMVHERVGAGQALEAVKRWPKRGRGCSLKGDGERERGGMDE